MIDAIEHPDDYKHETLTNRPMLKDPIPGGQPIPASPVQLPKYRQLPAKVVPGGHPDSDGTILTTSAVYDVAYQAEVPLHEVWDADTTFNHLQKVYELQTELASLDESRQVLLETLQQAVDRREELVRDLRLLLARNPYTAAYQSVRYAKSDQTVKIEPTTTYHGI